MSNYFKQIVTFSFLLFAVNGVAQNNTPQLLKEPSGWEFERFPLPPSFAADFPYKGAEELRFAPGMFKKDAPDYFTYAFVAQLEGISEMSHTEIKNYLLTYFKGLCAATARDRKLTVDTSKVKVGIELNSNAEKSSPVYNAVLNVFGVFADGAPVKLNAEVKLLHDAKAKKYIFCSSHHRRKKQMIFGKCLIKFRKILQYPIYKD